jgi:hypothetical protein
VKAIFSSVPRIPKAPILVALMAAACSQGRITKVTPAPEAASFSAPRSGAWKAADSLWNLRRDSQSAWSSLVSYRRAAAEQPRVAETWTGYARACHFVATYAEQNKEWSNPERMKSLYMEGARAAENALRLHPEYAKRLTETGDEADAVRVLNGPWLQPAYWLAANRRRWALQDGARPRLEGGESQERFMRYLAEHGESLLHGGPHRFLAVVFLTQPAPRADSARAHLDRAYALQPLYFANRTVRAQYLAVFEKDSAAFRSLLEEVLSSPADTLPEAAIENEYEQARARNLLSRQAELFP